MLKKKRKFCPKCGAELKETDEYCIKCGYSFKKRKKTNWKTIIIIIVIFVVAWTVIRWYLGKPILSFP